MNLGKYLERLKKSKSSGLEPTRIFISPIKSSTQKKSLELAKGFKAWRFVNGFKWIHSIKPHTGRLGDLRI